MTGYGGLFLIMYSRCIAIDGADVLDCLSQYLRLRDALCDFYSFSRVRTMLLMKVSINQSIQSFMFQNSKKIICL